MGFRQAKNNLYTPEQIKGTIQSAGVDIVNEVDSDYIIFCPYHNNYRTPAAEVSKDTGMFFCFSCQESKSLDQFVMFVSGCTYFEALRIIDKNKNSLNILDSIDKMLEQEPEYKPYDDNSIRRLHEQALRSPRAMEYYEGRKIYDDSIRRHLLGYSANQDMVTIPIATPDGKMFVGFVARSVEGKEFKNTNGLPKSKVLFNLHRARKSDIVYVVESSFDAIRLDQCGVAAVATLGANVSRKQAELLEKYFNSVVVIGDNDDAGKTMQKKILERLGSRVTLISIPDRFKDIGDMTDEDITELVKRIDNPVMSLL
jgi:DNA primase